MDIAQLAMSIATQAAAAAVTGRPALLTDSDLLETLLTEVRAGVHLEPAAAIAGVDAATVRSWLKRGQEDELAGISTPRRSFFRAFKSAQAIVEAQVTRNVIIASEKPQFWAAGMTYLERSHPERWGRPTDRVERGSAAVEVHVHGIDRGQVVIGVAQPGAAITGEVESLVIEAGSDKVRYVNSRPQASVREIAGSSDVGIMPAPTEPAVFAKETAHNSEEFVSKSGAETRQGAPAPAAPACEPAPTTTQISDATTAAPLTPHISTAHTTSPPHDVTSGMVDVPYLVEGIPLDPGGSQSKKKPRYKNPAAARRAEQLHQEARRARKRIKTAKALANARAYEKRQVKKSAVTVTAEKDTVE